LEHDWIILCPIILLEPLNPAQMRFKLLQRFLQGIYTIKKLEKESKGCFLLLSSLCPDQDKEL